MVSPAQTLRELTSADGYFFAMKQVLLETYFAGWPRDYLQSEAGQKDIEDHVRERMLEADEIIVPWVRQVYDLTGKSVLEIGCGTGSATMPFALRAGQVISCDASEFALKAAQRRTELTGIKNVTFHQLPPQWAQQTASLNQFMETAPAVDLILLIAVLEHLTPLERVNVLHTLWKHLREGGVIVIYETPNRLNFFDWHTTWTPFTQYLPDDLAIAYMDKSPRTEMHEHQKQASVEALYRLGRGVSYHEFELALDFTQMTVLNDSRSDLLSHRATLRQPSFDNAIDEIFRQRLPHIPPGFACPSLDLVIQKKGETTTDISKTVEFLQPRIPAAAVNAERAALVEARQWLIKQLLNMDGDNHPGLPPLTAPQANVLPLPSPQSFNFGIVQDSMQNVAHIFDITIQQSEVERLGLYALVAGIQPATMLEIGSAEGGSATVVVLAMDYVNKGRLICIDPAPEQITAPIWERVRHRATMVAGFSPKQIPEAYALAGSLFDMAFIDGNHTEQCVYDDITGCLPYLADVAYLLFHDSFNLGVQRGIQRAIVAHSDQLRDCGILFRSINSTNGEYWGGMRLLVFSRPVSNETVPGI